MTKTKQPNCVLSGDEIGPDKKIVHEKETAFC